MTEFSVQLQPLADSRRCAGCARYGAYWATLQYCSFGCDEHHPVRDVCDIGGEPELHEVPICEHHAPVVRGWDSLVRLRSCRAMVVAKEKTA